MQSLASRTRVFTAQKGARPAFSAPRPAKRAVVRAAAETEVKSDNGTVSPASVKSSPSNMLDFEELSEIIRMVHDTDIVELELKSKKFSLSVRKQEALKSAEPVIQYVQAPAAPTAAAPVAAAPAPAPAAPAPAPAPAAAPAPAPAPAKVEGIEVCSPMSGSWYRSPAPGEPPFIKEGDVVKKGQTVGIIEAMKLMNEIEAEVAGTVVKLLVENGQAVTPGMPLLVIKP